MEDSSELVRRVLENCGLVADGWELNVSVKCHQKVYELWHSGLRYFASVSVVETRAFVVGVWTQKSFFSVSDNTVAEA